MSEGLHFEESRAHCLRCGICGVGALRLGSDLRLGGSDLIRRVGRAYLSLAPPVNLEDIDRPVTFLLIAAVEEGKQTPGVKKHNFHG